MRRRALVFGLCSAISIIVRSADALPPAFYNGPFLRELTDRSVEVRFESKTAIAADFEILRKGASKSEKKTVRHSEADIFHTFRIDGLEPATNYEYAIRVSAGEAKGNFQTAPSDPNATFQFIIYGDNRTDHPNHTAIVNGMKSVPADFLLHTGDFVEDGSRADQWHAFFEIERELLMNRTVFASVGNHELRDPSGTLFLRYFAPALGSPDRPKLYGSFRWGSARFFSINTFHDWGGGEERAWLDKELEQASKEPGIRWRIVYTHQGPWSSGPHGGSPTLQSARIPELFAKYNVDLIVSGHDHLYERGDAQGLRYIVSGGGGAPLYRVAKPLPSTRKSETTYHFIHVAVTPEQVALVTQRADGSILEKCSFTHKPGWECDPSSQVLLPQAPASATPLVAPPSGGNGNRCSCDIVGAGPGESTIVIASLGALGCSIARRRSAKKMRDLDKAN